MNSRFNLVSFCALPSTRGGGKPFSLELISTSSQPLAALQNILLNTPDIALAHCDIKLEPCGLSCDITLSSCNIYCIRNRENSFLVSCTEKSFGFLQGKMNQYRFFFGRIPHSGCERPFFLTVCAPSLMTYTLSL